MSYAAAAPPPPRTSSTTAIDDVSQERGRIRTAPTSNHEVMLDRHAHFATPSNGSSIAAPQYELASYPHHVGHGVQLRDQPYLATSGTGGAEEHSPLTNDDPLSAREQGFHTSSSRMTHAQDDFLARDYAAAAAGGYPPVNDSTGLRSNGTQSTHHSRHHLIASTSQAQSQSGTATPIHPGASVTMRPVDLASSINNSFSSSSTPLPAQQATAHESIEKRYGAHAVGNEKLSGYSSPRSRSRERSAGGGLGNWSGPAGFGASPYGTLGSGGNGNGSGMQSAASSSPNLVYAEGDFIKPPSNAFTRTVFAIYDSSFLVRWIIYIIPVLALLWIPGIIGLTYKPSATVWEVPLVWWSAWLSIVWCGWWGGALAGRMLPHILRHTLGVIAPELTHLITYLKAIRFYVGASLWGMANWVSFIPMVQKHKIASTSDSTLSLIIKGLFGIFLVLSILLVEKLVIQIIAHNFHKKSYEDRILEQKFQISALVALYLNTRDLGRSDTLDGGMTNGSRPRNRRQQSDPTLLVKNALRGVKKVAQTATTVIGTVASEIAGEQLLKPTSAQSMVLSALGSSNKSKQLARRIYYSYCPSYRDSLLIEDISRCFQNREQAEKAFAVFDRDGNGDATRDELEMAVLDIHRERTALSRSMRDIDSAVGRLDSIIMSIWYVVSVLILAGLLNASFNTMITSAGTLVLGLSWLIGTTAQEILASIILLFVKHPYDVGDRVDIEGVSYVVLEMHLLSTVFRNINGTVTQAPHSIINTKFVQNIRRSGAIYENFLWDVAFATPFEKIEQLRDRMFEFVQAERRDFLPQVDITIKDFESQGKLTLSTNINYRGNWQNGALKAQRRNKFVCALKLAMSELKIYGPDDNGDPNPPPPDPTRIVMLPFVQDDHLQPGGTTTTSTTGAVRTSAVDSSNPLATKVDQVVSELTSRRAVVEDEGEEDFDTRDRDTRGELRK